MKIEILRGYEVLSDNNIRFGIRITNNTDAVISDVHVLLDYNKSLFKLQGEQVQVIDKIQPTIPRTVTFLLKPLGCAHQELIDATITYRDHKWEKHVVIIKPKEIHCVCPFLRSKPITKGKFLELSNNGHSVATGINFQGVSKSQLTSFLMQTCNNRLYMVDEYSIDDDEVLYFSSESVSEKAYYLLAILIREQEGLTQVMLKAVSDKEHGVHGFLNEIVSELKHMVLMVNSAKEIGLIKHELVINIIDSVVQRTNFSMGKGRTSVNVEGSVVQNTTIQIDDEKKERDESASYKREDIGKHREEEKRVQQKEDEGDRMGLTYEDVFAYLKELQKSLQMKSDVLNVDLRVKEQREKLCSEKGVLDTYGNILEKCGLPKNDIQALTHKLIPILNSINESTHPILLSALVVNGTEWIPGNRYFERWHQSSHLSENEKIELWIQDLKAIAGLKH